MKQTKRIENNGLEDICLSPTAFPQRRNWFHTIKLSKKTGRKIIDRIIMILIVERN